MAYQYYLYGHVFIIQGHPNKCKYCGASVNQIMSSPDKDKIPCITEDEKIIKDIIE